MAISSTSGTSNIRNRTNSSNSESSAVGVSNTGEGMQTGSTSANNIAPPASQRNPWIKCQCLRKAFSMHLSGRELNSKEYIKYNLSKLAMQNSTKFEAFLERADKTMRGSNNEEKVHKISMLLKEVSVDLNERNTPVYIAISGIYIVPSGSSAGSESLTKLNQIIKNANQKRQGSSNADNNPNNGNGVDNRGFEAEENSASGVDNQDDNNPFRPPPPNFRPPPPLPTMPSTESSTPSPIPKPTPKPRTVSSLERRPRAEPSPRSKNEINFS